MVVVTDDGTTDESRRMIASEFPQVRWVQGPQRGPAANRNHGAANSTRDWLIFLDDDCLPDPGYLKAYRSAMTKGVLRWTALEGRTLWEREPDSLLWEAPHNPTGGNLISCNFAIPCALFREVGGFDERYPGAAFEDTEFAARFLAKGGRSAFVPGAEVIHPLRRCPGARKLAARWEGKVIYALDQGAPPLLVRCWLLWHVLRVIQSRFRGQRWSAENRSALRRFVLEWLWVAWLTSGWVDRWKRIPRSEFWVEQVRRSGPAPKFGF